MLTARHKPQVDIASDVDSLEDVHSPEVGVAMKTHVSELAIHGGPPVFSEPLHVGRPNIPSRTKLFERFHDILDRVWLTNNGVYVREFEQNVADYVGVKHCIATASGTAALEIATTALDLTGEVIVPAMTFIATPHALAWRGITPVFADIDPDTCCIDPAHVSQLITEKTSAIVGVHLWGQPCDVRSLSEIAIQNDLRLMFDSSHAFGCSHEGVQIGQFGDVEVFSFHATKFVAAGEGGAVVTNCDKTAERLRCLRNFGFVGTDQVGMVGTNAKMSEMAAAFGITSLEEIDSVVAANRKTYSAYARALSGVHGIELRGFSPHEAHNYQYIVAHVDEQRTGLSRDRLLETLHAENILARRYFHPGCHRSAPYGSSKSPCARLPVTDRVAANVLCLPAGRSVSGEFVEAIARVIRLALEMAQSSGTSAA
ncbi:MAG: DegT/DnrJ/EryC1/StrS family aminotransferase [Planctomycetaceae bacterium]